MSAGVARIRALLERVDLGGLNLAGHLHAGDVVDIHQLAALGDGVDAGHVATDVVGRSLCGCINLPRKKGAYGFPSCPEDIALLGIGLAPMPLLIKRGIYMGFFITSCANLFSEIFSASCEHDIFFLLASYLGFRVSLAALMILIRGTRNI